jgi:hypothetical protein
LSAALPNRRSLCSRAWSLGHATRPEACSCDYHLEGFFYRVDYLSLKRGVRPSRLCRSECRWTGIPHNENEIELPSQPRILRSSIPESHVLPDPVGARIVIDYRDRTPATTGNGIQYQKKVVATYTRRRIRSIPSNDRNAEPRNRRHDEKQQLRHIVAVSCTL